MKNDKLVKKQQQILLSGLLFLSCFTTTVLAHNIQTSGEVGVTFHIEPDHSPIVGQKSQAWFALTRQGGKLITLSECDCELKVYLQSGNDYAKESVLNPPLVALSPEKFQNIPGANLVFPKPGIYQLKLTGKPLKKDNFTPFEVAYSVTVNPALSKVEKSPVQTEKKAVSQSNKTTFNQQDKTVSESSKVYSWLFAILFGGLGIVGIYRLFK